MHNPPMLLPRLPGLVVLAALVFGTGVGCGGTNDDRPPQWSFISPVIIEPACATVNCHSAITHQGHVDLSNATIGYQTLVQNAGGQTYYVYPGQPDQAALISLLNAVGSTRMPPDNPLPQADIALISKWISDGAKDN